MKEMLNYSLHNLLIKAVILGATLLTSTSAYAEDSNLVKTNALTGQFAASPLTKSQAIAQAVVVAGANNMSQVNSVSQLSDVQPNDWAFQSLQSLVERYGCIAGYPNGTYRGNSAITRYEFAAGLNACLSRVNELIVTGTSDLVTKEVQAWLQLRQKRFEQFKGFVFWLGGWVGSGRSGILFFISAILISATATVMAVINLPINLSCPDSKSLCYLVYQMRFNNTSVILPRQAKDILAEYERNKSKPKRRK